nr:MAG TPA: hypothetical protein [Crassvirales sp.]
MHDNQQPSVLIKMKVQRLSKSNILPMLNLVE